MYAHRYSVSYVCLRVGEKETGTKLWKAIQNFFKLYQVYKNMSKKQIKKQFKLPIF